MFKELFVYVVIYEYMINIDEGLMKMVDDRGTTFQARYNRHSPSIDSFHSRYFNVHVLRIVTMQHLKCNL